MIVFTLQFFIMRSEDLRKSSGSLVSVGAVVEGTDATEAELDSVVSASFPISVSLRSCTKFTRPSSLVTQSRSRPAKREVFKNVPLKIIQFSAKILRKTYVIHLPQPFSTSVNPYSQFCLQTRMGSETLTSGWHFQYSTN